MNTKQEQIVVACQGEGLCDDMTLVAAWDGSVPAIAAESCAGNSTGSDSEINTDNESDSDHKTDSGNGAGTNPKDDIAEDENTGSDENLTPENQSSDKSDLASQTTTADGKELSQTGSSAASFALLGFALFALGLCAVLGSRQRRK